MTIDKPTWRILYSGDQTGEYNMALDEAILQGVEAGQSPPTIRLFGWKTPVISLGYMQKAKTELDFASIHRDEIEVVRRPTGGRAVLHIDEWAYSIIARNDCESWGTDKSLSYHHISQALVQTITGPSGMPSIDRGEQKTSRSVGGAFQPCFASTSRYEVVVDGKKLVGSAQRRRRDAFLQHGSILCSERHLDVVNYLLLNTEQKQSYFEVLKNNAISLERWYQKKIDRHQLFNGFLERLAKALGVNAKLGDVLPSELKAIEQIISLDKISV